MADVDSTARLNYECGCPVLSSATAGILNERMIANALADGALSNETWASVERFNRPVSN